MIKKSILALAALSVGSAAYAAEAAKSDKVEYTFDITYVSDYVWRGVIYGSGESALLPSLEASYGDFYAGVWHRNELSDKDGGEQDETDLYAGYKLDANDTLSFDFGASLYIFDGDVGNATTEAYLGVNANVLLSPSFYAYYDFDLEIDTYIANIGYSLPIKSADISFDFSLSGGFVNNYRGDGQEYIYGVFGVNIPYKFSDAATLSVGADYIVNDDDNFKSGARSLGGGHDTVVGKVGLTVTF